MEEDTFPNSESDLEVSMTYLVRGDHFPNGPERLSILIQEAELLRRTIEVAWQSVQSLEHLH
jgi:hypothetical protein